MKHLFEKESNIFKEKCEKLLRKLYLYYIQQLSIMKKIKCKDKTINQLLLVL